jgi:hypothetical protein
MPLKIEKRPEQARAMPMLMSSELMARRARVAIGALTAP